MNSRNLIICDPEEGYAQALAMYFMQKKDLFLQVYVCSSPQRAIGLGEEVETDFLLISEDYEENVRKKLTARKVFILTSQLTSDSSMEYPVIYKWKLTQYDVAGEASDVVKYYRVRKSWEDATSQLGAYTVFANAKVMADKHPGYEVYDWNGKQVYPEVAEGATGGMSNADCPFLVKVSIPDLNIRKGSGTNTAKTGQYTGIGVFTIVEVREGKGSDKGWGRLKSGAGWIALDFCQRV